MNDYELTRQVAEKILKLDRCRVESGKGYSTLFSPLTNPAHLQMVKDEIIKRWGSFVLNYHDSKDGCGNHYLFNILKPDVDAEDESEGRAICLAALQAVEEG